MFVHAPSQELDRAEEALASSRKQCSRYHGLAPDLLAGQSAVDAASQELRTLKARLTASIQAAEPEGALP